jgi:hypothetical protein
VTRPTVSTTATFVLAALSVAALSLAGCSSDEAAERLVESQLDADSGDIEIQTDEGNFSAASSATLPDDFPGDLPTPSGQLTNASRIESDGRVIFTLIYSQPGDGTENAYSAYEASLAALGYETIFESTGGGSVSAQMSNDVTLITFNGGDTESGAEYQVIVAPVAE